MLDVFYVRFWISLVWVLNHIPFGPRFDLEVVEIELGESTENA